MNDHVECYSGAAYGERPLAFTWHGKRVIILEVLSQGRTTELKWFRVRTTTGELFELSFNEAAEGSPSVDEWQIKKI
jgi:hypothetical protein